MTIGERIKQVRKGNGLTLDEFGNAIKIAGASVSRLERGVNNPADRTIELICSKFGVREEWLRRGEGEMYAPKTTFNLDEFARQRGASDLEIAIVKAYFNLNEATRKDILENFSTVVLGYAKESILPKPKNVHDWTDAEMHAELQRQLDAEKRETDEPSTSFSGSSGAATA